MLKCKFKALEIAVGAGKSLNFNANFIVLRRTPKKKEQTQKDLRDKITHVVEKKRQSQGSFALNGVLEKWEMCP